MLILELYGAQGAERGVRSAGVVDLLDESGRAYADVFERLVVRQVDRLDLEDLDETLVWKTPAEALDDYLCLIRE